MINIPYINDPLTRLITIIIIIVIVSVLIKIISYSMNKMRKHGKVDMSIMFLIKDLTLYGIYIFAGFLILDVLGINIAGILVSIGIIGLSVGFAAKDIISNFMSGISIITDKTARVGEEIEVKGIKGIITEISFRKITVKTPDNLIVSIPNALLNTNTYINHTHSNMHIMTFESILPFNIDLKEFEEKIKKIDFNWAVKEYNTHIVAKEINEEGTIIKIYIGIKNYDEIEKNRVDLANEVRKIINNKITEE